SLHSSRVLKPHRRLPIHSELCHRPCLLSAQVRTALLSLKGVWGPHSPLSFKPVFEVCSQGTTLRGPLPIFAAVSDNSARGYLLIVHAGTGVLLHALRSAPLPLSFKRPLEQYTRVLAPVSLYALCSPSPPPGNLLFRCRAYPQQAIIALGCL
ncbi:hypothetical protein NDU88_003127, partial [Pleurodeles waltl]